MSPLFSTEQKNLIQISARREVNPAPKNNGLHSECRFEDTHLEELNRNFATLNRLSEDRDKWVKEYIDRTMPIKSHFWILIGSLSILATFATVMQYVEKITP